MALAMPDCRNPAMDLGGVGGGIDELTATDADELPAPAPAPAGATPPDAAPAPAANPLTPARAAPTATAPARTNAKVVDPTSPEITRLAIKGISATARA